ncbi:glycosyltransferase [Humibacillus sp. DSM 29435]|uniref:glycosyltransferase n=1 Tax=Humibacillus sp. DSM 29435 TaxID=1869167 RepID=UPI00158623CE|nr:glycosyltransferase [Humibacillus sp. DSM 29435]
MRVLLVGMGSRGDVQPFVALGESLQRLGYTVSLAAADEFRDLVVGHGLRFEPLSFDLRGGIESDIGREWLGGSSTNQVREARLMRTVMRHVASTLADDLERLIGSADAVVSSALTFDAVETLAGATRGQRTPHVYATFQPVWPTGFGASSTFALQPRSRSVLNLGWSWVAAQAAWSVVRSTGDLLRRRHGLPGRTMFGYAAAARRTPTLLAASPLVVPPSPDWPASIRQTGFWFPTASDASEVGVVDPALRAFVDDGSPPVYLGFGSMPTGDPVGVVRTFVTALHRAGRRGIVSSGWADLGAAPLPGTVLAVATVPHDWLFPRCVVVVHHGGAGTTAAALRAGAPQVVVPHIADQPYWGRRVSELGVGSAPLSRKHFDAERLRQAIEVALSPTVASTARDLGEQLRDENGAGHAASLMHALLSGAG